MTSISPLLFKDASISMQNRVYLIYRYLITQQRKSWHWSLQLKHSNGVEKNRNAIDQGKAITGKIKCCQLMCPVCLFEGSRTLQWGLKLQDIGEHTPLQRSKTIEVPVAAASQPQSATKDLSNILLKCH
jgi:hypothetical protein